MAIPTRYEIIAYHAATGRKLLVGYTPRLSRPGLIAAMRNVGDSLIEKLPILEADEMAFGTQPRPHATIPGWWIGFSGRTQRDAKTLGELPFIADDEAA